MLVPHYLGGLTLDGRCNLHWFSREGLVVVLFYRQKSHLLLTRSKPSVLDRLCRSRRRPDPGRRRDIQSGRSPAPTAGSRPCRPEELLPRDKSRSQETHTQDSRV